MLELIEIAALPEAKGPIPESVGLDTAFACAGAGAVLMRFLSSVLGQSEARQNAWAQKGLNAGFIFGVSLYVVVLAGQLL